MALDLRKLSHFVAVAQELNFTHAAARLHMSQQALSTSIRQLERELGVTLLERSTRHVELTDGGRALLEEGRPLLAGSDAAVEHTRRVGRGETEELHVGHTPAVTGAEVSELARGLRARRPEVRVSVHQLYPRELVEKLWAARSTSGLGGCSYRRPG